MPDHASQLDSLRASVPEEDLTLPMLVWSDAADRSEVLLVSSPANIRQVCIYKTGNITGLLDKIATLTKQADPISSAFAGDELMFPFNPLELDLDHLNWQPLLDDISIVLNKERDYPADLKAELIAELENNFRQDVTAGALDAIYASIINYLVDLSNELGVRAVGIVGELAFNDRFRSLLIKNINEDFQLRFASSN